MVKASLRSSKPGEKPATVVDVEEIKSDAKTTTAAPAAGLENILPESAAPPQDSTAAEPGPTTTTTALARRPNMAVDRSREYTESGFDGDWGAEDLKFPQLKQVQGSGPLSTEFDNGTIIYGEVELLPPPSMKENAVNRHIRFVPISITKQFREKLSEEAVQNGDMPRIFNSIQEVEDAGLTTRWVGNSQPDNFAEPSARCLFLLELPEGSEHPGFSLELDGKQYGVCVYYAAGGAFRDSAKIIFNTAQTSLLVPVMEGNEPKKTATGQIQKRVLLYRNFWTLNFAKKKAGNFTPWRPIVKLTKDETGPGVRAYIDQLLHGTPAEAAEAE